MTHRDELRDVRPDDGLEDGHEHGTGADPRADLIAAWTALTPPTPPASLAEADPATRAAVRHMRSAWHALTPPAMAVPPALTARRRRDTRDPAPRAWRPLAAAALLLVALAGPLLLSPDLRPALPGPTDTTPGNGTPPAPAPTRHVVSASPEALELRSGPVRLLLLTPDGSL